MIPLLSLPPQRRNAVSRVISALGDANIVGLYVMGYGQTTSGGALDLWADYRSGSANAGPTLSAAGTARPAVSSTGVVTFDGLDDYLRASGGRLTEITDAAGLVIIGQIPTYSGSILHAAGISNGASRSFLFASGSAGAYNATTQTGSATYSGTFTGIRVMHGRRSREGGNLRAGARLGATTEASATSLDGALTINRLTVGAGVADAPTNFTALVARALVVYAGDYASGAQYEAVNRLGLALGATL